MHDIHISGQNLICSRLSIKSSLINKVAQTTLLILGLFFVYPDLSFGQISRGADEGEIYVKCFMYIDNFSGNNYDGLLRSTDNGEHLSVQHYFVNEYYGIHCLADAFPGVVYHINDSVLGKSTDFGVSWTTSDKPKGKYAATGDLPGELYITAGLSYAPYLYRTSDFGASWISVDSSFTTKVYNLLDVGSVAGEIYAIHYPVDDTLELKYSNNYGNSFSSIIIDTSLIINSNMIGVPIFTHGTIQGEFYLIRGGLDGFYIFHTIDNGETFEYQSKQPVCPQCHYDMNLCSFSAGRTPGSFYYMKAPKIDSLGQIMTHLCIDYSEDYGKTFTTHCYILDSTFTSIKNIVPPIGIFQLTCFPNPTSSNTEINYSVPRFGYIDLCVYNSQGILIKSIVHSRKGEGSYSINWDGKNEHGYLLTPGVYILTLKMDGASVKTEKVVVFK